MKSLNDQSHFVGAWFYALAGGVAYLVWLLAIYLPTFADTGLAVLTIKSAMPWMSITGVILMVGLLYLMFRNRKMTAVSVCFLVVVFMAFLVGSYLLTQRQMLEAVSIDEANAQREKCIFDNVRNMPNSAIPLKNCG